MLKIILLIVVAGVGIVLALAALRPDTFRVQRSASIKAPPERMHALINDLHAFNTWNPWARKDPAIVNRYEGPASGPGAIYGWESGKVGSGRMQIIGSTPAEITMALVFIKPFASQSEALFTLTPEPGGTRVTWAMEGATPYLAKVMHLLLNMDRMVGSDFEDGLAQLKAIAEKN